MQLVTCDTSDFFRFSEWRRARAPSAPFSYATAPLQWGRRGTTQKIFKGNELIKKRYKIGKFWEDP